MNVIITGASKGIGRAIAEKFAANGHHLILCARNEVQLYKTMEELLLKYPDSIIKAMPIDLNETTAVKTFGYWADSQAARMPGGMVHVLVNNAGQFLPGSIFNEEEGLLEKIMAINLYSVYHLTRLLLPRMMENKKGHIFNMCSIASLSAYKNGGAYSISKFALLGFSKNLREEMKPFGIKVTAVMPGAVYTDSWKDSDIPAHRLMESEDIAELIFTCAHLSPQAAVEEIIVRPQLGDL